MSVRSVTPRLLIVLLALATGLARTGTARADDIDIAVPAVRAWIDTGIDLKSGQVFGIEAEGRASVVRPKASELLFSFDYDARVGPEGTYVWPHNYAARRAARRRAGAFALPTMDEGPSPAFCLIGKIGDDGEPFYVGRDYRGVAPRAGWLWLGINDDELRDNSGGFHARFVADPAPRPVPPPPTVIDPLPIGRPIKEGRVLLLYVDGLRPDIVHEMAEAGFLPNIQRTFLDGGLECVNAFTTFPSNTLVANGGLFTGLFPDRTAIKSQNQFERTTQVPRGQLGELMPDWLLARTRGPTVSDLLDKFAPENTYRFLRSRGIVLMSTYLGPAYQGTILPITPINPPLLWLHSAMNTIRNPFASSVEIPHQLDAINAHYVTEELLGDPDAKVIAAWFPLTDKVSHHTARGQFGPARREIAAFDRLLGAMLKRLRQVGWDRSTYLILISDHGHMGGEERPNRRCNLARDLFFRRFGCNVKVVGQRWMVQGSDPRRFVFLDHQGWGQAAIYLPKGSYATGGWARNSFAELLRYDLGPNRGTVNLIDALGRFRGPEWAPGTGQPVDLVLAKLDDARVLVYRDAKNQAIIHHRVDPDGIERFRYEPVRRIGVGPDGEPQIETAFQRDDPLGYLLDPTVQKSLGIEPVEAWMRGPYDAREWLRVSAGTRFPKDAVARYAREPDFEQWGGRLHVYGLDLRYTPGVEAFAAHLKTAYDRLDFILNNACQTVRRPPDFYRHLMDGETRPLDALPPEARGVLEHHEAFRNRSRVPALQHAAALSQLPLLAGEGKPDQQLFPAGQLDADLQQVDLRKHNSWRLPLAEVSAIELLEVHLVNAVAPFILNARLKPLMLRHPSRDKHIVNVSAMEGQFYRASKTDKHPHTNMAKAALNMMTRTSAADYITDGIHMNSVDTGWITDEDPVELAERKRVAHDFYPPLDHVDAAARICDPIFSGFLTGQHVWGQFLKDYRPTRW